MICHRQGLENTNTNTNTKTNIYNDKYKKNGQTYAVICFWKGDDKMSLIMKNMWNMQNMQLIQNMQNLQNMQNMQNMQSFFKKSTPGSVVPFAMFNKTLPQFFEDKSRAKLCTKCLKAMQLTIMPSKIGRGHPLSQLIALLAYLAP